MILPKHRRCLCSRPCARCGFKAALELPESGCSLPPCHAPPQVWKDAVQKEKTESSGSRGLAPEDGCSSASKPVCRVFSEAWPAT